MQDVENFVLYITQLYRTNILIIEYKGYGVYEGEPSFESIKIDGEILIDYIFENPILFNIPNTSKISIMGYSIGTGISSYLASKYKFLYLILFAPFLSIDKMAEEMMFNPYSSIYDNLENIKNSSCPVLILHGDKDTVINVRHSRELVEECHKIGKNTKLVEFNTDHGGIICKDTMILIKYYMNYELSRTDVCLKSVYRVFYDLDKAYMSNVVFEELGHDASGNVYFIIGGKTKLVNCEHKQLKIYGTLNHAQKSVTKIEAISSHDIILMIINTIR
eukprot:Mrub_06571.p1 GENE.Mrub_06571~~Mrub_06571.p1  ORF type:complete len:324 (-),score=37.09 Mrub_06571:27-854(-)